jgi:hypothetical protein
MSNVQPAKVSASNRERLDLIGDPDRFLNYRTRSAYWLDFGAGMWIFVLSIHSMAIVEIAGVRLATMNFILYSFGAFIPFGFARVIESLAESNQRLAEFTEELLAREKNRHVEK